jgi:hypothetical protein
MAAKLAKPRRERAKRVNCRIQAYSGTQVLLGDCQLTKRGERLAEIAMCEGMIVPLAPH